LTGAQTAKAQKSIKSLLKKWEMIPINQEITEAAATLRRETAACFVLRIGIP
jgi:hypothetical protein